MPQKKTLTMLCFFDASKEGYPGAAYSYTDELMDAVVRFNNTDPEFRVEIKTKTFENDAERDRLLIELATSDGIDLIDTSLLPENAIGSEMFVDMLPYIDADGELDRGDFIQPLLKAMMRNGALYEYTDKFTLLTLLTQQGIFTGRAAWTTEYIQALVDGRADLDCISRERMSEGFILAATAEFIDRDTMTCSFDSAAFQNWLRFLNAQPEVIERYENQIVFHISTDLAGDAGFWARVMMDGEYAVAGFPDTEGTGSYFMKLNGVFGTDAPTLGCNTRVGILASGENHDGAWRFVRTLMTGERDASLTMGISVLKERFEKTLEAAVAAQPADSSMDGFNERDAQILREQVYNSQKLVSEDENLRAIIRSEAAAYFAGQRSVEEAAANIQNRVSLYLAEQT